MVLTCAVFLRVYEHQYYPLPVWKISKSFLNLLSKMPLQGSVITCNHDERVHGLCHSSFSWNTDHKIKELHCYCPPHHLCCCSICGMGSGITVRRELSTGACCHRQRTAHLLALSKSLDLTDCKRRDNRWRLQTDGEAQTSTETIMLIVMGKMHSTLGALPWPLPCVISRGTKAWESSLCGAARCSRLRMLHFRVFRCLTTSAVSGVPIKPVERHRQLQRGMGFWIKTFK